MDPTARVFETVMYPTAAYTPPPSTRLSSTSPPSTSDIPWPSSYLNPKNRIESLSPPAPESSPTKWRIDGAEADGTRFFILPAFARGKAPRRIDTYIPAQDDQPGHLRGILQSTSAMVLEGRRVGRLGISRHILRALEWWSANYKAEEEWEGDFETVYMNMPFGSQIVVENICADVRDTRIHLLPIYHVEQQWLSLPALHALWSHFPAEVWPEVIDIEDLQLLGQPHEAISLVRISPHRQGGEEEEILVFKSLAHDVRYLYHELKTLLSLPPHPGVVSKPRYLVTKQCRFGGKVGVAGFILEFYPGGTLRDALRERGMTGTLDIRDQFRWARQVILALIHIHNSPIGFYSDIKLNNVMLAPCSEGGDSDRAVLVDFEQRGGWYSWSPPEVYYVEYLEYIIKSFKPPQDIKDRYTALLQSFIPAWKPSDVHPSKYSDSTQGYSTGWLSLTTPGERESAMVFMLGKLLWCLFEGLSSIGGRVTVETFRDPHSDQAFPEFRRTPPALRELIRRCTAGAPEWEGRFPGVVRWGSRIFPRGRRGIDGEVRGTAEETIEVARQWWRGELRDAEAFVEARVRRKQGKVGQGDGDAGFLDFLGERPGLRDVLQAVEDAEAALVLA